MSADRLHFFNSISPLPPEDEKRHIEGRLCSVNFDKLLHWFIILWCIHINLLSDAKTDIHTSTEGRVKLNVADEDTCKSHLVIRSDSHSSWANLAWVADT